MFNGFRLLGKKSGFWYSHLWAILISKDVY